MTGEDSPAVARARAILAGERPLEELSNADLIELATELEGETRYGYARTLLERAAGRATPGDERLIAERRARCTYKDRDLRAVQTLDDALDLLEPHLGPDADPETLGLAGAVHKRLWEVDGQERHLRKALAYHRRGHALGVERDLGFNGINAAFTLDLLAELEAPEDPERAATRRGEATRLREQLVAELPLLGQGNPDLRTSWWYLVTQAEALFGLGRFPEAAQLLRAAASNPPPEGWQLETTARQLARIALMRRPGLSPDRFAESDAGQALRELVGDRVTALSAIAVGKVGLALSGGGFRASLFHIGVLAYLAERDVLRHVEVVSCVSGGSIVGAHYYLGVRARMLRLNDSQLDRAEYVALVRELTEEFLAGVQTNIRTRVAANPVTVLKTMFVRGYSRTLRIGELLEKQLYSRVDDEEGRRDRHISDLYVNPAGEQPGFHPKYDNWRRSAKVPILVLNATTLNTGHNWQFTASWMGEPPAGSDSPVDRNDRLRRMYYSEAPNGYRKVRLGRAVAASACVPLLFDPIAVGGLFRGMTLRLVDGGVYDNQGVSALVDQDCTVLLVSDASGQMQTRDDPGGSILSVASRSNSVLMARVRAAQHEDVETRRRSRSLRGLMYVHLRQGLGARDVSWADAPDLARPADEPPAMTPYGIRHDAQARLAAMRTDLDSFSEVEAYSLMASGFRLAEYELGGAFADLPQAQPLSQPWPFARVLEALSKPEGAEELMRHLTVSRCRALKIWRLWLARPGRRRRPSAVPWVPGILAAAALVGAAAYGLVARPTEVAIVAGYALFAVLALVALGAVRPLRDFVLRVGLGSLMLLACPVVALHLYVFDRWFIAQGRVSRVLGAEQTADRTAVP